MSTGAVPISQSDAAIMLVVEYAVAEMVEENKHLMQAGSTIHPTASSIMLPWVEQAYGYLIRRSLALRGFPFGISFEEPYPTRRGCYLDLCVTVPDPSGNQQCGIELKWVGETEDLDGAAADVEKLLNEPALRSRYLLLYPFFSWKRPDRRFDVCCCLRELDSRVRRKWPSLPLKGLNRIAEGSFAVVYKGIQAEFRLVAVSVQ